MMKNKLVVFLVAGALLLLTPLIAQYFGNAGCASSTSRCSTCCWRWG
ncbi:hypothetical protein X551_00931 [Methylibium sp. T29]|nr:hypothetical protein X551_00931 [Methylibium sp. T29]